MKVKILLVLAASMVFAVGCGKLKEAQQTAEAVKDLSKAADKMQESQGEADKMYAERKAKGDTVAMEYKDLEAFLPTAISGYVAENGPEGSKTSMGGAYSLSTAEQVWKSTSGDTTNPAKITVKITDGGGTQGAFSLYWLGVSLAVNSENDHERMTTKKYDLPMTAGMEKLNKDNKEATVSVGTRYRYWIEVSATNQKEDQTKMLNDIALEIAGKLKDK